MSKNRTSAAESAVRNIARVAQALQHLNKVAEAQWGISLVQFHVLCELIDLPGSTPHLLATKAGIHPSTLTQSMKRLARKGFLHTAPDPKDSRRKQLTITRSGNNAVARFRAGVPEFLQLARAELALLGDLLGALRDQR